MKKKKYEWQVIISKEKGKDIPEGMSCDFIYKPDKVSTYDISEDIKEYIGHYGDDNKLRRLILRLIGLW